MQIKKTTLIASAVAALLFGGCEQANTGAKAPAATAAESATVSSENAVAIVNGKPISKASIDLLMASQRRGANAMPEDKVVEEVVKRELLRQEAEREGLAQDLKYAAHLENAQRMILAQAAMEHFASTLKIDEDELKKQYDEKFASMKTEEYKARHILVKTEQEAKDIIAKLQKGQKFDALAKKYSNDPGSKDKGGDLGWFGPKQMVAPFTEAVQALKNGETTTTPVKTDFGWHVIQREDSRVQSPPPFETVKEQLRSLVQNEKLQAYVKDLQGKARIENRMADKPPTEPLTSPAPATAPPGPDAGTPAAPAAKPIPPASPAPTVPNPAEKPQPAPKAP